MRTFRGGSNFICAAANQPNAREMPIHVIYFIRIGIHIQSIRRLLCLHHLVPTTMCYDFAWRETCWRLGSVSCTRSRQTTDTAAAKVICRTRSKKSAFKRSQTTCFIFSVVKEKVDVRVALVPSQIDWETLEWAGLLIEFIGKFLKLCFYLVFPLHKNCSQWILVQCPERAEEPMSFIRKYLLLLHSI